VSPDRLDALAPPARLVDWSIFTLVAFEVISGLVSLTVGTPDWGWLFVVHSVAGFTLVIMLFWKFYRVHPRVTDRSLWDGGTVVSLALAVLALAALSTGLLWTVSGLVWIGPWTLLTAHMLLGLLVVPVLAWHLRHRFRLPRRRTIRGRRETLRLTALVAVGAATWRMQELGSRILGLAGADRRFTGSAEAGGAGNDFPVTSWVADDPEPVDREAWRLRLRGEVEEERAFTYGDLTPDDGPGETSRATEQAVLDCTSGWYAERDWEGIRVGDLLDTAKVTDQGQWVRFRSVTGYRWSLPIEEARDALLATHVDGDPLEHGHGAPARLVAPGRRGFQWVKWVDRVEVLRHEDLWQWIAIFVSGFE
jgi:DMSO/TMAO reductase YedYZ molybdopterin-dependent catalytic subunit